MNNWNPNTCSKPQLKFKLMHLFRTIVKGLFHEPSHVWVHRSTAFTLVAASSAMNACTHTYRVTHGYLAYESQVDALCEGNTVSRLASEAGSLQHKMSQELLTLMLWM